MAVLYNDFIIQIDPKNASVSTVSSMNPPQYVPIGVAFSISLKKMLVL